MTEPVARTIDESPDTRASVPSAALVVSVVGSSGAGKTTVIERLVPLLRAAGLRVGTSKHASHGFTADREGSDSWRHLHAGADAVLLVGPDGAAVFLARRVAHPNPDAGPHQDIARLLAQHVTEVDVVLAEGYAPVHDLLIEVRRDGIPTKATPGPTSVWLTVTDRPSGADQISFDALAAVSARIVERIAVER